MSACPVTPPVITETAEYGVALRLIDTELADEFDDYLSEQVYVLFNIAYDENGVIFYFGLASERSKVLALFEGFLRQN